MASFNACNSISAEILELVSLIFSRYGLIEGIMLFNLALIITPIVPVNGILSCCAIFRALKSSNIKVLFGNSKAKAIALDSPLSICNSRSRCLDLSEKFSIITQSGNV